MMSSATDCERPVPRKRLHSVSQRRQNKPLIEKRRRARINECLLQLKALLMKDMGKESPRPSKLEKADILEMTVDYIKKIADKKPENPSSNTSTEKSQPAPFLDGFSRCMEEVDTFLDNQLHLLPEVRHKLLSHCKGQITSRDLKLEDQSSRVAASLRSVSPDSDDVNVGDRSVCDSASDGSSSDEEAAGKVNVFRHSDDVRTVTSPSSTSAANTTTTTAFVAPFQHTSASPASSMSPQMCAQNTTPANNGIKLAGPLKLICGGNVFIVVDQQQQTLQQPQQQQQQQQHQQQQQNYQLLQQQQISSKSLELAQPVTSSPVLPVGSLPALGSHQVLYSPSMYSNGAFTTAYIPSLPQMNVNHCVGIPTSNVPLIATGSAVCSVEQKIQTVATALSFVNKPVGPNLTPPPQPSPEVFVNAGNDVNNNEVGHVMQGYSSMWRPW